MKNQQKEKTTDIINIYIAWTGLPFVCHFLLERCDHSVKTVAVFIKKQANMIMVGVLYSSSTV